MDYINGVFQFARIYNHLLGPQWRSTDNDINTTQKVSSPLDKL